MEIQNPTIPTQNASAEQSQIAPPAPSGNSNRSFWKTIAIGMSIVSFCIALAIGGYLFGVSKNKEAEVPNSLISATKNGDIDKIIGKYSAVWSPNKKKFFFVNTNETTLPSGAITLAGPVEIKVYDTNSGKLVKIETPEQPKDVFYNDNHPPFWIDNDHIVVVIPSFDKSVYPDTQGIWIYSTSSGKSERLIAAPISPNKEDSISPDKKYILYSTIEKDEILNFSTGEIISLSSYANPASWSPDSNLVAYQDSWSKDQRGLWITNTPAKESTRIVSTVNMDATSFYDITWSSDSNSLTFKRIVVWGNKVDPLTLEEQEEENQQGIWTINADGTNLKKLSTLPTN